MISNLSRVKKKLKHLDKEYVMTTWNMSLNIQMKINNAFN